MRTLKKTLCLVLCVVMIAGLCMISTSAAFTDAAEINYAEAVNVMAGAGILNGIEQADGTFKFDPTGTLTREQAAKIITYVLGMQDIKASCDFADCKGNWAESAIAYCASEGIVNGTGDGNFNPKGILTGNQFAKMLLCAVGYNADYEGMTGTSWEIGVAKLLKTTGIADNIEDYDGTKAMTREEACQMAFDAMQLDTKNFKPGMNIVGTGLTVTGTGSYGIDGDSLAESVYHCDFVYSTLVDTPATVADQTYSTLYCGLEIDADLSADMVGHVVKVFYNTQAVKGINPVYYVEDVTTEVVITSTMTAAQVKAAFNAVGVTGHIDTIVDTVADGMIDDVNTKVVDITLGTTKGSDTDVAGTYFVYNKQVIAAKGTDQYNKVLMTVDAYTAATEKATGTVTISGLDADANFGTAAAITLQKVGSETADIIELYDGIAVGAYVYVTKLGATVTSVEPATIVKAGTLTALNTSKKTATVDGTAYTYVDGCLDAAVLNTKSNYVLNAAGKIAAVTSVVSESTASSYGMILDIAYADGEVASISNGYKATGAKVTALILAADGSKTTYSYTSSTETTVAGLISEIGYLYSIGDVLTYGVDADGVFTFGSIYVESAIDAALTAKTAKVDTALYLTATTPVVYQDLSHVSTASKVVTGYAKVQEADKNACTFVTDSTGKNVVVVFVDASYSTDVVAKNIAFLPADVTGSVDAFLNGTVTNYNYTVYVDGVATTLVSAAADVAGTAGFVTYTLTNDKLTAFSDTITGYTALDGTVEFLDDATIVIDGTQKALAADAVIIAVDSTNAVTAGGTLALDQNVKTLYNTKGEVAYIAILAA